MNFADKSPANCTNSLMKTFGQSIFFGIVGMTNTGIDLSVFFLLFHFLHWDVIPAQVASYTCGLINSYFFNRMLTFRQKSKPQWLEMIRFISLNAASCGTSIGVLTVLRHVIQSTIAIKFFATGVTLAINFAGSKWWVFRHHGEAKTMCHET